MNPTVPVLLECASPFTPKSALIRVEPAVTSTPSPIPRLAPSIPSTNPVQMGRLFPLTLMLGPCTSACAQSAGISHDPPTGKTRGFPGLSSPHGVVKLAQLGMPALRASLRFLV